MAPSPAIFLRRFRRLALLPLFLRPKAAPLAGLRSAPSPAIFLQRFRRLALLQLFLRLALPHAIKDLQGFTSRSLRAPRLDESSVDPPFPLAIALLDETKLSVEQVGATGYSLLLATYYICSLLYCGLRSTY